MLYPELFGQLEKARWNMADDIPWADFDGSRLTDEQAHTIKMNAITEWSALPATEMFLRDNQHDSDFSAFMSIWFYEEQKHALVLMEYLRRFCPELCPTEEELHAVRFEFDPAPPLETLMLHFCGEVRLTQWYRCASEWHTEPVIKASNPRGDTVYWVGPVGAAQDATEGTDFWAVANGYASVTPLMIDLTARDQLDGVRTWLGS